MRRPKAEYQREIDGLESPAIIDAPEGPATIEAYTIVLDLLVRLKPGETLGENECVEQGLIEGHRAYLLRRISSEASIGKILFSNGYRLAAHMGLTEETTVEIATRRKALLREFRALSRRMERMRIEVVAQAERIAETDT